MRPHESPAGTPGPQNNATLALGIGVGEIKHMYYTYVDGVDTVEGEGWSKFHCVIADWRVPLELRVFQPCRLAGVPYDSCTLALLYSMCRSVRVLEIG